FSHRSLLSSRVTGRWIEQGGMEHRVEGDGGYGISLGVGKDTVSASASQRGRRRDEAERRRESSYEEGPSVSSRCARRPSAASSLFDVRKPRPPFASLPYPCLQYSSYRTLAHFTPPCCILSLVIVPLSTVSLFTVPLYRIPPYHIPLTVPLSTVSVYHIPPFCIPRRRAPVHRIPIYLIPF
ncbi:hypothetical protein PENTCL1PPCAC_7667, partial [Pristionchus entomophagus]